MSYVRPLFLHQIIDDYHIICAYIILYQSSYLAVMGIKSTAPMLMLV